jgi:putative oxidoreductase
MTSSSAFSRFMTGTNSGLLNLGVFLLRATIGVVLFMTGAGKLFGWFGGFGMEATIQYYIKVGFTDFLAYVSSLTEFIGGFLLVVGFFTRPVTVPVAINMLFATIILMPHGFIAGQASYPFTFLISAIIIMLTGPRAISLDYLFWGSPPRVTETTGSSGPGSPSE